jgi:hypothetical protein
MAEPIGAEAAADRERHAKRDRRAAQNSTRETPRSAARCG